MEEKKTVVETVAVVEKAEVKKVANKPKVQRKPRKPIATTAGKIPAVKTAGQEKPKAEKVSAELKNMAENVACLPSFAGKEKETLALAKAIIAADTDAIVAIIDKLPRPEKALAMSLNNAYAAKKAAAEKGKKANVKLTKEQEERALARTLFEAMAEEMKAATIVARKGLRLKAGDFIKTGWIVFRVKAVTADGVYCEYFEDGRAPESKGIFRHMPDVVIDPPAAWPEDVIIKRVATPAPAGAAK